MQLVSDDASGCANSDPRSSQDDEKVGEFTEGEQRTAEYQAERSADVTRQCKRRVRRLSFDVRVLQLREEHLQRQTTRTLCQGIK